MTAEGSVAGVVWRPNRRQVLRALLGLPLTVVLVVWWLPTLGRTTWGDVLHTLSHIGAGPVLMLFVLMSLGLWSYTFTLTGSLPGLRHVQALIANLCGSSAGNLVPAGGAAGVAVSYATFRSWGFSRRAISTSIIVTGVWNILARMILPVVALIALLVAGGDLPIAVIRGGVIGAVVGVVMLAGFILALASERVTRWLGQTLNRALRPLHRRISFLREVRVEAFISDQRVRIVDVIRHGWLRMTFGMIAFFGIFYVLFWQSMHVVGLRMPFSYMFAAYAVGRLLTAIGITPGGVGVTEGGAVAVLVSLGADPQQALFGTVLFSLFTHVMEVPLGALAFLGWAASRKTAPTDGIAAPES